MEEFGTNLGFYSKITTIKISHRFTDFYYLSVNQWLDNSLRLHAINV